MSKKPDLVNMSKGMTAEEAIRERIENMKARGREPFTDPEIRLLEWVLSLLKTDRMALAGRIDKILDETSLRSIQASDIRPFLQWLDSVKTQIHAELESKSEMR